MSPRYDVTVWNNMNGDIERHERDIDDARLEEIEDWYGDPWLQVVVDREYDGEDE